MKNEIQNAIATYDSDKEDCLRQVRALLQQFPVEQQLGAEAEIRKIDGGSRRAVEFSPKHTVFHWLKLAEEKLMQETGDSNAIAIVPVLTSLNTALQASKE